MERSPNGRGVVAGLFVSAGRVGASTGRLALYPARVVARSPLGGLARGGAEGLAAAGQEAGGEARRRLETAAGEVFATEAERTMDGVLAGPLPEAVARSMVEHRVVERVVAEVLASTDLEAAIVSALEREQTEHLVEQVLASPALERFLLDAVESRLTVDLTDRVIHSPAFEHALAQVLSSPQVRTALTRQTTSLADEMATGARRRAIRVDSRVEAPPRRWRHRPPRIVTLEQTPSVPYGGLATRGIALAIDAFAVNLIFLTVTGLIGLVTSLFGTLHPTWLAAFIVAAGWTLLVVTYFTASWTTAGQTPGMRLMRLHVLDNHGSTPGFGRSLLRLAGLAIAIAICFLGFVPALFDDRRRALQDMLAGTVVYYDEHLPQAASTLD